MSRKTGAYVAATMKRVKRFTTAELAVELDMSEKTAARWMLEFSEQKLIAPDGFGKGRGRGFGVTPIAWAWQA